MKKSYSYFLLLLLFTIPVFCFGTDPDTLIRAGAAWKYLDNGSDQGTAWTLPSFNDSSWATGNAELGYGDNDEVTVVSFGPDANNKFITTYFRTSFNVVDASIYKSLRLYLKRDDGAIAYINGNEVYRSNMPEGPVTFDTLASSSISGGSEQSFILTVADASWLVNGLNGFAVEIHQNTLNSSDISFDLSLIGDTDIEVIRGPYLQIATSTSMNVCWRTNVPEISKISFGTTTSYSDSLTDTALVTEHVVKLSGLIPNTKYYYAVSSQHEIIAEDSNTFFITPPIEGTSHPTRIWTMGDFGTGNDQQNQVRDAYLNYTGNTYTNMILFLGDNAYPTATDEQYSTNVFSGHYENMLKQSVLYSTCGNHEWFSSNSSTQTGPYYDIFNFPANGEAGGVASGTEAYYSFDYSNIHFICLESNIDSFGTTNASNMITWLNNDLAANTRQWTIVYFHAPPYSKGYHDSDIEIDLIFMRQNIVPILEANRVDLVLCGHDHDYERSYLLNGHFGTSSTFNSSMIVDSGNGTPPNFYRKFWPSYLGTVYAVVGCASDLQPVQLDWPYPAMYTSLDTVFGSMVIDVNGDTLDAKLISMNGIVKDHFAIYKRFTIGIEEPDDSHFQLDVYPDPAHSELTIQLACSSTDEVTISILDVLGQTIISWKEKADKLLTKKTDISNLSNGIYFVNVRSNSRALVKQFVKE